jgi:predicted RNA-binding Zn-ribbon protein involved in translation (DUF1610 family)
MSDVLRCTGCQAGLRMRPEFAGKKLRCPRCKSTMNVPDVPRPAAVLDDPPPLPNDDTDLTTTPTPEAEQLDVDLDRPRRRDDDDEDDYEDNTWHNCPRCGATDADRVLWTFWGSFYGPAMFNHVQCPECGTTYNGKTGRSNFIPALIFVTIPVLLIMGLLGVITWMILARQYG